MGRGLDSEGTEHSLREGMRCDEGGHRVAFADAWGGAVEFHLRCFDVWTRLRQGRQGYRSRPVQRAVAAGAPRLQRIDRRRPARRAQMRDGLHLRRMHDPRKARHRSGQRQRQRQQQN